MNKRTRVLIVLVGVALALAVIYVFRRAPEAAPGPAVTAPNGANAPVNGVQPSAPASIEIDLVPLESFANVPELVRFAFSAYRCHVPQPHGATEPSNLISGHFAAPDQTDWAALCTRGDSTFLTIVWGGPENCPAPIARAANLDFVQGVGNGQFGYSRGIAVAGMEYIQENARAYGGPPPPSTNHEGIEDAFIGKASVIHYCYAGQWVTLQGAD